MKKSDAVAIYLRLSQEDDKSNESESIANQRELTKQYIADHNELCNSEILEFVDDGYSGVNFNRPAISDLLAKVKNGEISCIVVKDFSRFGRNFTLVGDYIEQIFPFLGVRFIAINNSFDSKQDGMKTSGLDIAFSNLINDFYSKDISKKIKSSFQAKMRKGDYLATTPRYGYKKMQNNKNKLEIDPIASKYVRKLFELFLEFKNTTATAKELNILNIPTPLVYKQSIGQGKSFNFDNARSFWTAGGVLYILRDMRYIGATVSNKRPVARFGSKQRPRLPESEWIIVHNTHDAIISNEDFEKVRRLLGEKKKRPPKNKQIRLFTGKIMCGCCNHKMRGRYNQPNPKFFCDTPFVMQSNCTKGGVFEKEIETIVINSLRKYAELTFCVDKIRQKQEAKVAVKLKKLNKRRDSLSLDQGKVKKAKTALYEKYMDGIIDKELYIAERDNLEIQIIDIIGKVSKLDNEMVLLADSLKNNKVVDKLKELYLIKELSPQLVQDLVSVIKVFDKKDIEIIWKFKDALECAVTQT